MPTKTLRANRAAIVGGLALIALLAIQVAVAVAAGPETFAQPQVVAQQLPTPTPFRFVQSTGAPSTTTTTSTTTAPRAGGFPVELALPALAGGLAAIGGGSFLLRRKKAV